MKFLFEQIRSTLILVLVPIHRIHISWKPVCPPSRRRSHPIYFVTFVVPSSAMAIDMLMILPAGVRVSAAVQGGVVDEIYVNESVFCTALSLACLFFLRTRYRRWRVGKPERIGGHDVVILIYNFVVSVEYGN